MLLIDAFNVLHLPQAVRDGRALSVADLAGLIGTSRYAGQRAVLICDGTGGPDNPKGGRRAAQGGKGRIQISGTEVVFSGAKQSADDEIEARLRRAGGHGVVVVSDDRRLRRAAGRAGAKAMASGAFLRNLLNDHDKPKAKPLPGFTRDIPLDRFSVAHWMRQFGISPNGLLERQAGKAETTKPAEPPPPPSPAPPEPGPAEPPHAPTPKPGGQTTLPTERALDTNSLADDPVIREALEAWEGRLTLEDLDMARWLSEHPPGDRRDQR